MLQRESTQGTNKKEQEGERQENQEEPIHGGGSCAGGTVEGGLRQEWSNLCEAMGFCGGSDGKESACNSGDSGSIPGSGRSPRKGIGYPPQYSCLENSMDRVTWRATVHGVTKSQTWVSNSHTQLDEQLWWVWLPADFAEGQCTRILAEGKGQITDSLLLFYFSIYFY